MQIQFLLEQVPTLQERQHKHPLRILKILAQNSLTFLLIIGLVLKILQHVHGHKVLILGINTTVLKPLVTMLEQFAELQSKETYA